jgi:predicted ribosomally synthesized peptide with nif11-like leader
MAQDAMMKLVEALESDAGLRSEIVNAKSPEDVVAVAAAHGYAISTDDVRTLALQSAKGKTGKLDDESLAEVVGGLLIGGGAKQERKTFADYWYQIWYA